MNKDNEIELRVLGVQIDLIALALAILIGPLIVFIAANLMFTYPLQAHPAWIIGIISALVINVFTILGALCISEYYKKYLGIPT